MNIFAIDQDPIIAAKQLCGRHSVKMPTETSQILCYALPEGSAPMKNKRNAHFQHPASIWARESKENFDWTIEHGLAQCAEYSRRYKRRHAAQDTIEFCRKNMPDLPAIGLTQFARCFSEFKTELDLTEPDTVKAYRSFYWKDKAKFARWPSLDEIPEWWPERSERFVDKSFKNGEYTKRGAPLIPSFKIQ